MPASANKRNLRREDQRGRIHTPRASDADAPYSAAKLARMDERFRERMQRAIERGLEKPPEDSERAA